MDSREMKIAQLRELRAEHARRMEAKLSPYQEDIVAKFGADRYTLVTSNDPPARELLAVLAFVSRLHH